MTYLEKEITWHIKECKLIFSRTSSFKPYLSYYHYRRAPLTLNFVNCHHNDEIRTTLLCSAIVIFLHKRHTRKLSLHTY